MAVGLAFLLGFRFPQNFNSPYKAVNISDFWRRWHMSLSFWLRDYLFIPLGGSRGGALADAAQPRSITMFLGGLWHGAAWTFVVWGLLHGALPGRAQPAARSAGLTPPWSGRSTGDHLRRASSRAFVIFRAPSLRDAGDVLSAMAGLDGLGSAAAVQALVGLPLRSGSRRSSCS